MADISDTVTLHNELAYADMVAVEFRPLAGPVDAAFEANLADRNLRLLQACAALEEHGQHEKAAEDSPHAADIMRIDLKVNLLLELVGHLLATSQSRPPSVPVRFNANGIVWQCEGKAPPDGSRGLVQIHLKESLVEPLILIGVIADGSADGYVHAKFEPMGEAVADHIEKLVFRRHRRQIAGARHSRR